MQLSDAQIEARLSAVEKMLANCRDPKAWPGLNQTFQCLLDEQVRRDCDRENSDNRDVR